MDILKLIQSAEETIYEIATWFVLLPKTLGQVVFKPQWLQSYVTAEWEKEPAKRFKDFLSPIYFWVFVAITPMFGFLDTIPALKTWAYDSKAMLAAVILIGVPLIFATVLQKAGGRVVEKDSLKRLFYLQCLPSAVMQCALVLSTLTLNPSFSFLQLLCGQLNLVSLLWFVVAETLIFKKELNMPTAKALGWVILTLIACGLVFLVFIIVKNALGFAPS